MSNRKKLSHEERQALKLSLNKIVNAPLTAKEAPIIEVEGGADIGIAFYKTASSPATDKLTGAPISLSTIRAQEIDPFSPTRKVTLIRDNMEIYIENIDNLANGLRPNTSKLLKALMTVFTQQNNYRDPNDAINTTVSITLEDYMILVGRKITKSSKKDFRKEVNKDLETLYSLSLKWTENVGKGKAQNYAETRIISSRGIINSVITVSFTNEFAKYLNNKYISYTPRWLFTIDTRNPVAYYVAEKLINHYGMESNQKAGRHNIIKVETLLNQLEEDVIPSYEEVMTKFNRNIVQKIIEPLEKGLNILEDTGGLTWNYCKAKHEPISDDELSDNSYESFKNRYISYELIDYPDRTERLEEKRKEEAAFNRKVDKEKAKLQAEKELNN